MQPLSPASPEELAEALASSAGASKTITLGGAFTKNRMGQPPAPSDVTISTAAMRRVLQYEPGDLTISVEAGLPVAEFDRLVGANRQMAPLDPPFHEAATIGGTVAANLSGPRRRLYGTARDLIIGMTFVTLDGKLARTGGMVVKNVAGLDVAKLMIGSFGTLAAIAVINFKLRPAPVATRTFVYPFATLEEAVAARDRLLRGVLQLAAIDLLNPAAAVRVGRTGYALLAQAGGSPAVIDRYAREMAGAEALGGEEEEALWRSVREFTPRFLAGRERGAVVRVSSKLGELQAVMNELDVPVVARAGSGVLYAYFDECGQAAAWLADAARHGRRALLEFGPLNGSGGVERWPNPGPDFAMMERVKLLFDPNRLLNRGRLYGRL
ncbi:MAG: FAD-binding protein [Bryobacteraceae bacterium]|nr:FAD-binding protein [Bryobacteraceae bacterium]